MILVTLNFIGSCIYQPNFKFHTCRLKHCMDWNHGKVWLELVGDSLVQPSFSSK